MLKRIKIRGYKSLVNLELNLTPLSVIVGSNASGKSNFLDALYLLSQITTSQSLDEVFDPPYRGQPLESFTFGDEGIKSLLKKEKVSFSIEVDVQLSSNIVDMVNKRIHEIRDTTIKDTKSNNKPTSHRRPPVSEKYLRYRIEIEMLPQQGILRVADEYLAALGSEGVPKKNRKAFLERNRNRLHLRMEGQSHPFTMNDILILVYSQGHTTHPIILI